MYTLIFDKSFEYILKVEGGYTNHKDDKGGETKYGIIKTVADKHGYNVKNLTIEQAKAIYYSDYFKRFKIDFIKDIKVAISVFDFVVNAGTYGIRKAQETLNKLGFNLVVDGIVGTKTLNAINQVDFNEFLNVYHKLQREYYNKIVERNPSQKVFLKGWHNRVERKEKFLYNINR